MTDRALIRELFVARRPEYGAEDARRLTRSAEADITAAIEADEIAPTQGDDGAVFSWDDVAFLALRRWTPRMIDGALDVDHRDAVPRLNRVRQIQVQLPLYQIRLLHVLAEMRRARFRGRINASDVLEYELLETATGELVIVTFRDRAFVGRFWTKHGRRALLDHGLLPIIEDREIRVLGAVTVVVRQG